MSSSENDKAIGIFVVVVLICIGALWFFSKQKIDGIEEVPQLVADLEQARFQSEQSVQILNGDRFFLDAYSYNDASQMYNQAAATINGKIQGLIGALRTGGSVRPHIADVRAAFESAHQFNVRVNELHLIVLEGPQAQNAPSGGGLLPQLIEPTFNVLLAAQDAIRKARAEAINQVVQLLEGQKFKAFQDIRPT